jgi:hypothetical protein
MVILGCGSIAAQDSSIQERPRRTLPAETGPPDADAGLKEVTLYWFHGLNQPFPAQPDDSRSSVNFETGERGPARSGSYDLKYGGIITGVPGHPGVFLADWLGGLDCRSLIVDLGAKTWQDFKTTPPLPSPQYLTEAQALAPCSVVVDASAGAREISPYHQMVVAKPGHVYFMRLVNGSKFSYLMFRVESLNTKESCVISWKPVTPPNAPKQK